MHTAARGWPESLSIARTGHSTANKHLSERDADHAVDEPDCDQELHRKKVHRRRMWGEVYSNSAEIAYSPASMSQTTRSTFGLQQS